MEGAKCLNLRDAIYECPLITLLLLKFIYREGDVLKLRQVPGANFIKLWPAAQNAEPNF